MPHVEAQLFRSFSDALPLGVCIVDTTGRIVYWNSAAEAVTGYLSHEVLGRAYRKDLLIQRGYVGAVTETRCPVSEVLRDGRSVNADLFLRHKQGHRIPVHVSAFALRDASGELRGVAEILDLSNPRHESAAHALHSERDFEMAMGPMAVEESAEQLRTLLRSRSAASAAIILIEIAEQHTIFQHGGAAMLHQALRVVARTVAALLPARHYVGCWSNWRLIAIVPECKHETLDALQSTLSSVGSSCAIKWWGDRVVVRIRAVAQAVDIEQSAEELIHSLEEQMKNAMKREE